MKQIYTKRNYQYFFVQLVETRFYEFIQIISEKNKLDEKQKSSDKQIPQQPPEQQPQAPTSFYYPQLQLNIQISNTPLFFTNNRIFIRQYNSLGNIPQREEPKKNGHKKKVRKKEENVKPASVVKQQKQHWLS